MIVVLGAIVLMWYMVFPRFTKRLLSPIFSGVENLVVKGFGFGAKILFEVLEKSFVLLFKLVRGIFREIIRIVELLIFRIWN